jgi:hypothetical protein
VMSFFACCPHFDSSLTNIDFANKICKFQD